MSPTRRSVLKLAAVAPVAALVPASPVAAEPEPEGVVEHRFDAEVLFCAVDGEGCHIGNAVFAPVRCARIDGVWVLLPSPVIVAELDRAAAGRRPLRRPHGLPPRRGSARVGAGLHGGRGPLRRGSPRLAEAGNPWHRIRVSRSERRPPSPLPHGRPGSAARNQRTPPAHPPGALPCLCFPTAQGMLPQEG